jgi:hypothetical protein
VPRRYSHRWRAARRKAAPQQNEHVAGALPHQGANSSSTASSTSDKPESLVYEPMPNGRLRLVAVE